MFVLVVGTTTVQSFSFPSPTSTISIHTRGAFSSQVVELGLVLYGHYHQDCVSGGVDIHLAPLDSSIIPNHTRSLPSFVSVASSIRYSSTK
ncbi:hypothetical protein Csa_015490 [Cucumis sativus]|uniref:Uncharacterized protein n=1 Tax=Cucumis sativus TaxID=3659 RepID=A0A0A0K564_CUCSA|nr:hypothetical protein Csa_015490 [Cucumis sativus]